MSFLPPGVTSNTMAGFPQIAYDNTAVQEWQQNTPFLAELCDFRPLPRRSGRTLQMYGQKPFAAATGTVSEGVPPSSLSLQQVTNAAFADEYGDWLGISNVAESMFVQQPMVDATRNLSYRGALTGNLVATVAFDNAATADSTARIDLGDNEFMLSATVRKAEAQLVGAAVPVRNGGTYKCAMHSFMSYDLFSDNSAGSATDTLKRSSEGARVLQQGQSRSYQVLEWSGFQIIRTSTVTTFANYPSNGKTGYGAYFVGKEAILASNLDGVPVPEDANFKLMVKYFTPDDIDLSNPMLQTRAICSYDWFLGAVARPNTNGTAGFRRVRGEVSAA